MKIWTLIVQPDFQANGKPFAVDVDFYGSVEEVKRKVKQKLAISPAFAHVYTSKLVVRKIEEMTLDASEDWEEILENIDDLNTIKEVHKGELVANLGLSDGQILLVQIMPGTSRISILLCFSHVAHTLSTRLGGNSRWSIQ